MDLQLSGKKASATGDSIDICNAIALGRVDILVNDAGSGPGGAIETLSEADGEQALQLKFMDYIRCLRYALPIMVAQGGGRGVDLIGHDVIKESCREIAPGAANAAGQDMNKALARDRKLSHSAADKLAPRSLPPARIAEVEEGASLCTDPASPLAFFVNGTSVEIDGGQPKPLGDPLRDRHCRSR